ncbi:MAG: acetylglutamate kinase [Candidatus Omnitrophica bacterium]|nr:acetylglutamate kinase [Candidatus Omnitrophota bacterium]
MREIIKKTNTLIEALPYIMAFKEKIFVIKIGGEIIENKNILENFLKDIAFLSSVGIKVILVHGGGQLISKKMRLSGIKPKFVDGLRITCKDTIVIVEDVLYRLNQIIVKKLKALEVDAVSITPRDNNTIFAKKRTSRIDLGFVGIVSSIDKKRLVKVLKRDCVLVVSPVGLGEDSLIYNINADIVASEIASALKAKKLIFMTNVDGIIYKTQKRLLSTISEELAKQLLKNGIIDGGMIPKVEAGFNAIKNGVSKVHIINARLKHALLLEIFTNKGIGTELVK